LHDSATLARGRQFASVAADRPVFKADRPNHATPCDSSFSYSFIGYSAAATSIEIHLRRPGQ
jgi:hypothetical protein